MAITKKVLGDVKLTDTIVTNFDGTVGITPALLPPSKVVKIATFDVDGRQIELSAPRCDIESSGGSWVAVKNTLSADADKIQIATIAIDGVDYPLYSLSSIQLAVDDVTLDNFRHIIGMRNINHYTYVGDDIEKAKDELDGITPDLSADLIWFDTKGDENFHQVDSVRRLDSLQVQIYRLGLQMRDMHKILENGVIPGDAYNNTKDEMIDFADIVLPPDEVDRDASELLGINVYGNYFAKNGQPYYMMLNPAGYPIENNNFYWQFVDHDDENDLQKTVSVISADKTYTLRANIVTRANDVMANVSYQASISSETDTDPTFVDTQSVIDQVIDVLSANEKHEMEILISSDYYDESFREYAESEPLVIQLTKGTSSATAPLVQIKGNDYIDGSALYYCVLDNKVDKLPLNVNTDWYFLSSYYDEFDQMQTVKADKYVREFYPDDKDDTRKGSVTFQLINYVGSPIAQVAVELSNCTVTEAKQISAELFVESQYDSSLSAKKQILGIGGVKPLTGTIEPTVKAVCAKFDEKANLLEKAATLYVGEIVYFSDANQLAVWTGSGFMVLNSSASSGVTQDEIQEIELDHLTFKPERSGNLINKISTTSDGKLNVIQKSNSSSDSTGYGEDETWGVYVSGMLQIGKIYCGGASRTYKSVSDSHIDSTSLISHNFVEIVNASPTDIYLDNIYLMYHTKDTDFAPERDSWEFIRLDGKIKANGTYLVRGAKCNPCKNTLINVDECDLEWHRKALNDKDIVSGNQNDFTRSGKLIEFSQNTGSFFLCYAVKNADGSGYGANIESIISGAEPKDAVGYIDLIGINGSGKPAPAYFAGTAFTLPTQTMNNQLVMKWYYMDPARQGNKARTARKNNELLLNVDMTKQPVIHRNRKSLAGLRDAFYFTDEQKVELAPNTSKSTKGIFAGRSHFRSDKPNAVNITFGYQATHNDSSTPVLASRCINWVSVGYFDEYVEIQKVGDPSWASSLALERYGEAGAEWFKEFSITPESDYEWIAKKDASTNKYLYNFHNQYDRIRWTASDGTMVTTHKCILKNILSAGKYNIRIRRVDDDTYVSDMRTITVHADSQVTNFSFVQTSDQQGFNWVEYQAWKAACSKLAREESDINFTINTGDIAQSGNRVNEWLDYFDGRSYLKNVEEMFTIGNNDLCGAPQHLLGDGQDNSSKFNLINVLNYYTFELDPNNPSVGTFPEPNPSNLSVISHEYPIFSLYSFKYGSWRFISCVSEIRDMYGSAFPETISPSDAAAFAKALNARVEDWLITDLLTHMRETGDSDCRKCVVYMHEMPFTIVTADFFDIEDEYSKNYGRSSSSTGCKLNLENKKGDYRFSRIFKKAGIRLVMGGHKHTFSLSNPLYDAPSSALAPDDSISLENYNDDPFISGSVDIPLSRKPVIEVPIAGSIKLAENVGVSAEELAALNAAKNDEAAFSAAIRTVIDNNASKLSSINDKSADLSAFVRIRFVKKVTAPTLVMSQATGYKVDSNKELPAATSNIGVQTGICRYTPWLMSYCSALESNKKKSGTNSNWSNTANPTQRRPTYVRYDMSDTAISVAIKQVDGVYKINPNGGRESYNLNSQVYELSCVPVTFGYYGIHEFSDKPIDQKPTMYYVPTTLPAYMTAYSDQISEDTYIISL